MSDRWVHRAGARIRPGSGANGSVIREPDHVYRPDDGPIWEALRG